MAEAAAATPTSIVGKQPAVKDKQCPFCQQPFTSSSLGRHLDLYIKEKNPKPPDDVHDVEEIKKIRGAITRRQARSSVKPNDDSTPSSSKATPSREQASPPLSKTQPIPLNVTDGAVRTYLNQANWQATGVINDLPPIPRDDQVNVLRRRTPSRGNSIKEDLARRQRGLEERDRGQAAELALKEVLENVRSASARANPSAPFDFNFFSLSLPQIYLKCLSPPPELLSEAPSLSQATWPIDPPAVKDCEIARSWLQDRLHDWRRQRENQRFGDDGAQHGANGFGNVNAIETAINNEEAMYNDHLTKAHQKWAQLGDKERHEQWHYECAKALAREREQHQSTVRKLEQTMQELTLLRNHTGPSHPSGDSRDLSQYQPALLPLSGSTLSHLTTTTPLDLDTLLTKWKGRIRSARSSQYPLPSSTWLNITTHGDDHTASRIPHLLHSAKSAPAATQEPQDLDLDDAPGEVEDDNDGDDDDMDERSREQEPDPQTPNTASAAFDRSRHDTRHTPGKSNRKSGPIPGSNEATPSAEMEIG